MENLGERRPVGGQINGQETHAMIADFFRPDARTCISKYLVSGPRVDKILRL